MNLLKTSQANWKYIVIVVLLAVLVGGGILWFSTKQEVPIEFPEIKKLEKVTEEPEEEEIMPEEPEEEIYKERYQIQEFITALWGESVKEVGMLSITETGVVGGVIKETVHRYGPQAFDIDKNGNLYILDSINMRVLRYDKNGEYLNSFKIEKETEPYLRTSRGEYKEVELTDTAIKLQDIAVKDGMIYIYRLKKVEGVEDYKTLQGEILKYTNLGEYLRTYQIPDEIEFQSRAGGPPTYRVAGPPIDFDEKGNPMVAVVRAAHEIEFCSVVKEEEEEEHQCHYGYRSKDGESFHTSPHPSWFGEGCVFLDWKEEGMREIEAKIPNCQKYACHCTLLNTDLDGNIYFLNRQVDQQHEADQQRETREEFIGKIYKKGELWSKIIDIINFKDNEKHIEISSESNVYMLVIFEDELKVFKYTKIQK